MKDIVYYSERLNKLPKYKLENLNIGSGSKLQSERKQGWINLDILYLDGIHVQADALYLPFKDNTFKEVTMFHVYEHFDNPLAVMDEVYRVCKPGAEVTIACPYYKHRNAYGDPGHKTFINEVTFSFLDNSYYEKATKMTQYPHKFNFAIISNVYNCDPKYAGLDVVKFKDIIWDLIQEIIVVLRVNK